MIRRLGRPRIKHDLRTVKWDGSKIVNDTLPMLTEL